MRTKDPVERTYRHYYNKQVLAGEVLTPDELKIYTEAAKALGADVYVLKPSTTPNH